MLLEPEGAASFLDSFLSVQSLVTKKDWPISLNLPTDYQYQRIDCGILLQTEAQSAGAGAASFLDSTPVLLLCVKFVKPVCCFCTF